MEEHTTNTLFQLFLRVNHKMSIINRKSKARRQKGMFGYLLSSHLKKDLGIETRENDERDFSRFL
ncbi:hypothetical protein MHO82_03430 [Vibrio sp. Of7-15]|uniref:hypothetical protein n=1 Tax=Vibrio sp. Of7-15 TaxID=2724879 RepID=UPI001EF1C153|nr:hypothetical protein [Vibrio sp. Of7-15]MCG7495901.1 hypothetical protein [Vibrio sp. Of7-15]